MTLRKIAFLVSLCIFASGFLANDWGNATDSAPSNQQEKIDKARAFFEKNMIKLSCDPPTTSYPRWGGFPVQNCSYTDVGITTKAYMLNPSADQLAQWTVTACQDAQATSMDKCITRMENWIQSASSGGIFPVSGYIVEPASSAGGKGNGAVCLLFRDGVTIATESWKTRAPVNGQCGPMDEIDKPATRAYRFARVASTRRQEYYDAGGTEPVGTEKNFDVRWLDVVRKLYQQAWASDRNQLVSAKAKAMKASGNFK